jgi:hypothetical protein
MQQKDSTLYAFLKKNAALSTGTPSSKRASDFKSTTPEVDKNYSFNAPTQHSNYQHSSG